MGRAIVVVDVETSSLTPMSKLGPFGHPLDQRPYGVATEVAWWNLSTGENASFVPAHNVAAVRAHGDIDALTVSRYLERLAGADQDDGTGVETLHEQLVGNTLAGSNPAFDARFLWQLFRGADLRDPWHHRLLDVSAYAAGVWGLPGHELPGLAAICERYQLDPPDHTAAGDVRVTGQCLVALGAVALAGRNVP